mgnify:CR=1 FL=1
MALYKVMICSRLGPPTSRAVLIVRISVGACHLRVRSGPPDALVTGTYDDPTGTQTVHDIPIVTKWTVEHLARELTDSSPISMSV